MNRTASLGAALLAAAMLHAQGIRQPRAFPPDIGPATVKVTGLDGKAIELNAGDLGNFPQHTVRTADHGTPATFEGVLLRDVLSRVDVPSGDQFHNTAASYYLVVEAADGYRAVFAWAELDPSFTDKAVYLVTHRDGKPLSSSDGPFHFDRTGRKAQRPMGPAGDCPDHPASELSAEAGYSYRSEIAGSTRPSGMGTRSEAAQGGYTHGSRDRCGRSMQARQKGVHLLEYIGLIRPVDSVAGVRQANHPRGGNARLESLRLRSGLGQVESLERRGFRGLVLQIRRRRVRQREYSQRRDADVSRFLLTAHNRLRCRREGRRRH